MRWPWRRRHRNGVDEGFGQRLAEARQARERADAQLRRVRAQWPDVREVAAVLRAHQEHNHFGDMIRNAIRGQ